MRVQRSDFAVAFAVALASVLTVAPVFLADRSAPPAPLLVASRPIPPPPEPDPVTTSGALTFVTSLSVTSALAPVGTCVRCGRPIPWTGSVRVYSRDLASTWAGCWSCLEEALGIAPTRSAW